MLRFCFSLLLIACYQILFGQTRLSDSTRNGVYQYVNSKEIKVEGYFKDLKRHKLWTWYNKDGILLKQIKYKHGRQLWVIYFENNKAWLKINRHGKKRIIRPCDCREVDYN